MSTQPDLTSGKRERKKEANRSAILEAARRCFQDQGYESVTIRDVIRLSGLAAGTFYNYFPDKESVFRALVESRLGQLQQRVHAARFNAATVERFFYETYLATFQEVRADPEFFALMLRNEPVLRSLYHDNIFGLLLHSLRRDVREAIARGAFPEIDVDALTAISFGAGYELCRLLVAEPRRKPEDLARFVTQLFIDGVDSLQSAPSLIRLGSRKILGSAR